jgi:hypothetical protein
MSERMTLGWRGKLASITILATCLLRAGAPNAAETEGHTSPPASPVSLLDLMRAAVEVPADGIWAVQAADKVTDDDWLLAPPPKPRIKPSSLRLQTT